MSIERIQFETCTSCGTRFRYTVRTGGRILCGSCADAVAAAAKARQEAVAEAAEDWTLAGKVRRAPVAATADGAGEPGAGADGLPARVKRTAEAGSMPMPEPGKVQIAAWHRWVLIAGFGLAVAGGAGAWIWRLRQWAAAPPVAPDSTRVEAPLPVDDPLLKTLPGFEESLAVARKFMAAGDVDAMLPWIRGGEPLRPVVADFLRARAPVAGAEERLQQMPPVVEGDLAYQSFGFVGSGGEGRIVAVVPTADGPKVDFKAYAEWSDVPFADLLAGKVTEAREVRLMLRPSSYYNYRFSDQSRFAAFDASAGSGGATVTLYAERGSPAGERLGGAMARLGLHPATLELRALEGSEKHAQFLITRLLALGYVVPGAGGT